MPSNNMKVYWSSNFNIVLKYYMISYYKFFQDVTMNLLIDYKEYSILYLFYTTILLNAIIVVCLMCTHFRSIGIITGGMKNTSAFY